MKASTLSKVLKGASKFMALESENRFYLKAVHLRFCQKDNTLVVFASHGCALFKAELNWGKPRHELDIYFTINKQSVNELIRMLNRVADTRSAVELEKTDKNLGVNVGSSKIVLKTMDSEVIQFDRIMNRPCPTGSTSTTLNLNDLAAACAAFKPLIKPVGLRKTPPVCIQIGSKDGSVTTELSIAGEQIHPNLVELISVRLATMPMSGPYKPVRPEQPHPQSLAQDT